MTKRTWASALQFASTLIDEHQTQLHVGEVMQTEPLFDTARNYIEEDPVLAAALTLLLAKRLNRLDGPMPTIH